MHNRGVSRRGAERTGAGVGTGRTKLFQSIYAPEGAITIEGSLDSEGLLESSRNDDELLSNNIRHTIMAKKGFDF